MSRRVFLIALLVAAAAVVAWWILRAGDQGDHRPQAGSASSATTAKSVARASRPARRGSGVLVGAVRVYGTDKPVAGATVTLVGGESKFERATDAEGAFAFAKLPKLDGCTLDVSSPEFGKTTLAGLVVVEGKTTDLGVVYLAPEFDVPGVVVNDRGAPVADAEVAALKPRAEGGRFDMIAMIGDLAGPTPTATTVASGADGTFRLKGLPPGTYTVVARKSGLATTVERSVLVAPGAAAQWMLLVMRTGLRLEGKVVHADGSPAADVPVVAFSFEKRAAFDMADKATTTTDAKGAFAFDGLVADRWSVAALPADAPAAMNDRVRIPQTEPLELRVGGPASLLGRVMSESGAAVGDARVCVAFDKAFAIVRTDATGRYEIRDLPTGGAVFFLVQAEGRAPYPSGSPKTERGALLELKSGPNTRDVRLSDGGCVRGKVVEAGTQKPVSGASVAAFSAVSLFGGDVSTTSGDDGTFELVGVPIGKSRLLVRKSGWRAVGDDDSSWMQDALASDDSSPSADLRDAGSGLTIVVAKSRDVVERAIEMTRGVAIKGRVVDSSGAPIVGARVVAKASSGMPAELGAMLGLADVMARLTDANGRFEIPSPVAKGEVEFEATAPGRRPGKNAVMAGDDREVEITLAAGGVVEGRVTDAAGAALVGAEVSCRPAGVAGVVFLEREKAPTTYSGADGSFRLATTPTGDLVVEARLASYAPKQATVTVADGATARVDVVMDRGLVIAGHVAFADGSPVTRGVVEARVEKDDVVLRSGHEQATLGADGAFRFESLAPGNYKLVVRSPEVARDTETVAAAGAENVEIRAAAQVAITGFVRFKDGSPAVGAHVRATPHDGARLSLLSSTTSGADGSFQLHDLAAGQRYDVVASAGDAKNLDIRTARTKDVPAGATGIVVEVEPGLAIAGRVLGPDGAPVAAGDVSCEPIEEKKDENAPTTDATEILAGMSSAELHDGRFEMKGLSPGKYRVTVESKPLATQTLVVEAGSAANFHLAKGATIKGRVLLPDGSPAKEASVSIEDDAAAPSTNDCETDDDGRFTMDGVAAGAHRIAVEFDEKDQTYEGEAKNVNVAEGATVEGVEIRLKKAQ